MQTFTVIEAQDIRETRIFHWEIEADSPEDAIVRQNNGEGTIVEEHRTGEPEYGNSGLAVQVGDDYDAAYSKAMDRLNNLESGDGEEDDAG